VLASTTELIQVNASNAGMLLYADPSLTAVGDSLGEGKWQIRIWQKMT
jgi:hypothetical protein